jgi:hypothetical protein
VLHDKRFKNREPDHTYMMDHPNVVLPSLLLLSGLPTALFSPPCVHPKHSVAK